jgi:hypothetical protein
MHEWTVTAVSSRTGERKEVHVDADSPAEAYGMAALTAGYQEPERTFEVATDVRVVTARTPAEAVRKLQAELAGEAEDKYAENNPNERYAVRPAGGQHWQAVYPD